MKSKMGNRKSREFILEVLNEVSEEWVIIGENFG